MSHALDPQDIQSLVLSGHSKLKQSLALYLRVAEPNSARTTLLELVRSALSFGFGNGEREQAVQLLLSAAGICALDGHAEQLAGLDTAFCEGIVTEQRSRALGDAGKNDPNNWLWQDRDTHSVQLHHARTQAEVDRLRDDVLAQLQPSWTQLSELSTCLPDDNREPFGFRDGVSNLRVDLGDGSTPPPGIDLTPPGAILLGHRNASGIVTPAPPLGLNGSYVVARQLKQDVEAFWNFWRTQSTTEEEAIWLAAKATGRWPNGMPIKDGPPGPQPTSVEGEVTCPLHFHQDRDGRACPFGAHIRRANPRDGLLEDPNQSLEVVAQHRILRRGRMYGTQAPADWYPSALAKPELDTDELNKTKERGLLFLCLCSDIARQFEFIQQTWLNNPKFADLYDESDPIAAGENIPQDKHRYSIPAKPIRRRLLSVQRWVTTQAGGYFLLPGRSALETWLANKPNTDQNLKNHTQE